MNKILLTCLLAALLHTLAWDSVNSILEIKNLRTGVIEQRLYQYDGECKEDRRTIEVYNGSLYAIGLCDGQVWLPWEQVAPARDDSEQWSP